VLDELAYPDEHGVPPAADPWDDGLLAPAEPTREQRIHAVDGWLERMRTTPRPLQERMAWVWHDHFATSMAKVRRPALMVRHVRLLQALALGPFRELLRAMTVDAAVLVWLDGRSSTAAAPNENHARELLELFTVGVDAHTEADVAGAARALTGWVVDRATGDAAFRRRRHDDTPQTVLGRSGVHDVDTVVDAAVTSPACAPFVTRALVGHLLGPGPAADAELVGDLAADFRRDDLRIAPLARAVLAVGLDRDDTSVVEAPVPWLTRAERATGSRLGPAVRFRALRELGQVPMFPPDVGGWPVHTSWLAAGTVLARARTAEAIAGATTTRDVAALAELLGHPPGLDPATAAALADAPSGAGRVAALLAAPRTVVV
jgi:uncharacterized protein (DUF1800 family)